jgi:hypothetical protein
MLTSPQPPPLALLPHRPALHDQSASHRLHCPFIFANLPVRHSSRTFQLLKMKPLGCLETSSTNYTATERHTLEERRLQLHRCESLNPRSIYVCMYVCTWVCALCRYSEFRRRPNLTAGGDPRKRNMTYCPNFELFPVCMHYLRIFCTAQTITKRKNNQTHCESHFSY